MPLFLALQFLLSVS